MHFCMLTLSYCIDCLIEHVNQQKCTHKKTHDIILFLSIFLTGTFKMHLYSVLREFDFASNCVSLKIKFCIKWFMNHGWWCWTLCRQFKTQPYARNNRHAIFTKKIGLKKIKDPNTDRLWFASKKLAPKKIRKQTLLLKLRLRIDICLRKNHELVKKFVNI